MLSYFIAFYTTDSVNWGMASALGAFLLADDTRALRRLQPACRRTASRWVEVMSGRASPPRTDQRPKFSARRPPLDIGRFSSSSFSLPRSSRSSRCPSVRATFLTYPLPGFSLRWYNELFDAGMAAARCEQQPHRWLPRQPYLPPFSGRSASIGLTRARFPRKPLVMAILLSPMIVPVVITAIGVYFCLRPARIDRQLRRAHHCPHGARRAIRGDHRHRRRCRSFDIPRRRRPAWAPGW